MKASIILLSMAIGSFATMFVGGAAGEIKSNEEIDPAKIAMQLRSVRGAQGSMFIVLIALAAVLFFVGE